MAYKDTILADAPHLYYQWAANNGTPTQLGSKTVTTTANAVTAVTGVGGVDYAGNFNGTSSYVKAAGTANNTFNAANWTVEAWFKRGTQTGYQEIFNANDASNNLAILQWWGGADDKKIVALFKGNNGTQISAKSVAITDTNWHHVAVTYLSGTLRLYIDGALVDTATGGTTATFGTSTPFRVGAYGDSAGNENWLGVIDEVATYPTALSASKIANRYASIYPISVNAAGVTPATASGLSVDPAVDIFRIASVNASADQFYDSTSSDAEEQGESVTLRISPATTAATFIKFPAVTLPADATDISVFLELEKTSGTATSVNVGEVTSAWSETTEMTSPPAFNFDTIASGTVPASGKFLVDITALGFNADGYVMRAVGGAVTVKSSESDTAPRLVVLFKSSGNNAVGASPFTGSASAGNPTVTAATNVIAVASVATASAASPSATVATASNPDALYPATPFTATGLMNSAGLGTNISTSAAIGSGGVVDVSVTAEKNAKVVATPATAHGYLEAPAQARDAFSDPYFLEIMETTDLDDAWYRLDEVSGNKVAATSGATGLPNPALDGTLVGNYSFGVTGPEGRRAIHFDDSFFENVRYQVSNEMTFEVVLRTTQKNGLIAYGLDDRQTTAGTYRNAIYLTDGKVTFNGEYTGIKNVADGQWHHIVVAWGHGNRNLLDDGMRIYIDGKLDIRRAYSNVPNGQFASPDWYFGMPDHLRPAGIPADFVGDAMEVVFRANGDLTEHDSQQLYYRAMGITPIEVALFSGTGSAGDAKGKGNQKRALLLYFDTVERSLGGQFNDAKDSSEKAFGYDVERGDFDFGPLLQTPGMRQYVEKLQASGYRIFFKAVDATGDPVNIRYTDYQTDLPRLLNLQTDVNTDDYDLIFYRNWPDEGNELDRLASLGFSNQAIEDHLTSLRKAVDDGVSLWISNPTLANRMGIVSKVELISTMKERRNVPQQGFNQMGNWNEHAVAIDPWGSEAAWGYQDTHRNNRERVVASIAGLTDIPSTILKDALQWDVKQVGRMSNLFSMNFEERPNGLLIGDEYVEPTMWFNDLTEDEYYTLSGDEQYTRKMYAVPPTAVLAGTPVTKLGTYTWEEGNREVANPYADYVGTIVVQPGDSLKGRPVGGKILVTISEDPRFAMMDGFGEYTRQLVPANEQIANPLDHEGPDKRAWDFSSNRWIFGSNVAGGQNQLQPVLNADGSTSYVVIGSESLVGVAVSEKYPTEKVTVLSMIQRGLRWLAERVTTAPGQKNVRPAPLVANGSMPNPTVTAQKSTNIAVQTAVAVGQMVDADEVENPDATVLALPATGRVEMVNYERKIVVGPFEGSGGMTEPEEVKAQRTTITVYLLRPEQITIYKEDN